MILILVGFVGYDDQAKKTNIKLTKAAIARTIEGGRAGSSTLAFLGAMIAP